MIEVRLLRRGEEELLLDADTDVFDDPVRADLAREFLEDPRHHMAVALDLGRVVGFASAVHYVHPDKPAELWIDEVGVAERHRRRGLGRRLVHELLGRARQLGCEEAWVLTERGNAAARAPYESAGGAESRERVLMYAFRIDASPVEEA